VRTSNDVHQKQHWSNVVMKTRKFLSYLKENTTCHHYKDQLVGLTLSSQLEHSVPISEKVQRVIITKINWLMKLHQENALPVDVFDKSISWGKAKLIFQNARCIERMRKLCVFRNGIYLSRLVTYENSFGRSRVVPCLQTNTRTR
jgi:hypothetical protein